MKIKVIAVPGNKKLRIHPVVSFSYLTFTATAYICEDLLRRKKRKAMQPSFRLTVHTPLCALAPHEAPIFAAFILTINRKLCASIRSGTYNEKALFDDSETTPLVTSLQTGS